MDHNLTRILSAVAHLSAEQGDSAHLLLERIFRVQDEVKRSLPSAPSRSWALYAAPYQKLRQGKLFQ